MLQTPNRLPRLTGKLVENRRPVLPHEERILDGLRRAFRRDNRLESGNRRGAACPRSMAGIQGQAPARLCSARALAHSDVLGALRCDRLTALASSTARSMGNASASMSSSNSCQCSGPATSSSGTISAATPFRFRLNASALSDFSAYKCKLAAHHQLSKIYYRSAFALPERGFFYC